MIDWHSHILPGMDDGSRSVEESLAMLNALREQGVDHVIATPHFYANDEAVDAFLERRAQSQELLREACREETPRVLCGAEVRYYPGIARMKDLGRLRIQSTKLLLLEMPMVKWTEYTIRELIELAGSGELAVVMAHMERYMSLQNRGVWEKLCDHGLLIQVNASFFGSFGNKRKAWKLLDAGRIHLIGSDCHNMTTRPPRIGDAYERIRRKFGDSYVSQMNGFGYGLLEQTL